MFQSRAKYLRKFDKIISQTYKFLTIERRYAVLACGVALAGLIFAVILLGWEYISGSGDFWLKPLYDTSAHLSGWLFYKGDVWLFPIFDTTRMDYPNGTTVALTDSIPIVALLAKIIGGAIAGNWHYFGVFTVVSYALNGVALVWLLRQMGASNALGALFAFVFACFSTLYSIQFESLSAQYLVIFSLGYYFRLLGNFRHRDMAVFLGIVLLAMTVHPYLFAMCAIIFAVTVATLSSRKILSWKRAGLWLGVMIVAAGLLYWLLGYISHPSTGVVDKLYGYSPVVALDMTDLFRKQYAVKEIGVYLGLGFWAMVVMAIGLMWRIKPKLYKGHALLIATCVLLFMFAISNNVFIDGKSALHVSLPAVVESMCEVFRASKRFVVPLYYLAVVVAFVFLIKHRSKAIVFVIVGILLLQVVDVSFFVSNTYAAARAGQPSTIDTERIRKEYGNVERVQVFPSYACMVNYGKPLRVNQWDASQEIYETAAQEGKISNSIRSARRTKDCELESLTAHLAPARGTINFYIWDDNRQFIIQPSDECLANQQEFEYGIYCKG